MYTIDVLSVIVVNICKHNMIFYRIKNCSIIPYYNVYYCVPIMCMAAGTRGSGDFR